MHESAGNYIDSIGNEGISTERISMDFNTDDAAVVFGIGALVVIWIVGFFLWQDPVWPLTVAFNLLGDMGIGHGTSAGYPWENGSMGSFPHSRYQ